MNIALIGSGGREHALCKKLRESKKINTIYCLPGNAGTANYAQNLKIDVNNHRELLKVINLLNIKVVIIGPEEPLVKGIVDFLKKNRIKVFGPTRYASKLEGSKSFMKLICKKYQIPTADFKICKKISDVKKFLKKNNAPIVVKVDGLAAGKGVTICKNKDSVLRVADEIFGGKFKSSKKLVLEEFLEGEELSYFIVADRFNYSFIGSAQDHKRVGERETGPNTGGMGAYSPSPILNKKLENKIKRKIIMPTLKALKYKKKYYSGFLYIGLMIKKNEPFLIEFNVRMGDPECQVILPTLKTDFFDIVLAVVNNNLKKIKIKWKNLKCMTIVICAKGYPKKYIKNINLGVLKKIKLDKNSYIFHAGTQLLNDNILSSGGRILNVTSSGKNFKSIRKKIFSNIKKLSLRNSFFRRDIGWRIIK
tara:strand:+ start:6120 stop:7382 length:1263 start_codon:yes stop_codon:yes gene_type:complete